MKMKVKDLTVKDIVMICKKTKRCDDCVVDMFCCGAPENMKKKDLEKEVEIA